VLLQEGTVLILSDILVEGLSRLIEKKKTRPSPIRDLDQAHSRADQCLFPGSAAQPPLPPLLALKFNRSIRRGFVSRPLPALPQISKFNKSIFQHITSNKSITEF
jgi:hypothetical protein